MGKVSMDAKQLKTYRLACEVLAGKLQIIEFSEFIGKSYRQAQRFIKRVEEEDFYGVFHKNIGRTPHNKTPEVVEAQIKDWLEYQYNGFNLTHFIEMVVEKEKYPLNIQLILASSPQAKGREIDAKVHKTQRIYDHKE